MKVALNLAFGSILVAVIAYARIADVRLSHVHSKDAVLGEALDPINIAEVYGKARVQRRLFAEDVNG